MKFEDCVTNIATAREKMHDKSTYTHINTNSSLLAWHKIISYLKMKKYRLLVSSAFRTRIRPEMFLKGGP